MQNIFAFKVQTLFFHAKFRGSNNAKNPSKLKKMKLARNLQKI